jgi:hypothetical protein
MGSIVPITSQLEVRSEFCIGTPDENEICSLVILLSLYLLDFNHLIFGTCKLVRWWGNCVIWFPITSDSLHSFIYNNSNQVFGLPLQAEITISKLTQERRSSAQDMKVLQEKLVTSWTTFFSCLGVSFNILKVSRFCHKPCIITTTKWSMPEL